MQNGWPPGTIEQNRDAGGTSADRDNNTANLASQMWATGYSELTELETRADRYPVYSKIHLLAPRRDRSNRTAWPSSKIVAKFQAAPQRHVSLVFRFRHSAM